MHANIKTTKIYNWYDCCRYVIKAFTCDSEVYAPVAKVNF